MILAMLALARQVAAWEEGDFEIFDLVDALEAAEGSDVNFYSWMGVTQKSKLPEIERAFRKKSRSLHPDKNKGPKAQEKYARLSSIITILRNDAKRERYNFFLKNGVPRWRGSAYLYRRHRPGFKAVVVFLVVLVSGFQYLARYVSYIQEKKRMSGMIEQYKEMLREKHQKILEGPITGRQRRSGAAPEAVTPLEEGPMYAVNQYGEEIELTLDNINPPKVKDVVIARLPFWTVKVLLKVFPKGVQESVLAMDIFESIRPRDEEAEADAKKKIRKAELAKKRAAKKAAQQKQSSPDVSDDEILYSSEDDDDKLAQRAKEEELAAARRRRRMKAPGQASLKGGRRG
ncbi:DnaJ homolog subfamily C member 1 [Entomortierella parvispora]|uniref:DnaJ homolog subfamily C member 1 n=1 Tax=Entomortierella parvispora TaxID=205924 RepID=A0A9P3H373_9FUNG|nr:DnaJ homolog subfamily C member 1 [Entomortierella parvispora]